MATAPADSLPLFYNALEPLSSVAHGSWKMQQLQGLPFLKNVHAVPLTVEEFPVAQRHFPIVFSVGENPVPLALMGLNEGVNVFIDDNGQPSDGIYLPAYARRYPFLLAKLQPDAEELSLCFDPSVGGIGPDGDGEALFADGQPADPVKAILGFCEQFETAGQRTGQFMTELAEHKLLMDGEVSIQPEGAAQPFIYRGFQMVSEDAIRNLRGDVARKLIQSGLMAMIYAHLFSLVLIRELFERQMVQGKMPTPQLAMG